LPNEQHRVAKLATPSGLRSSTSGAMLTVDTEVGKVAESATHISDNFARSPEPKSGACGPIEKPLSQDVATGFDYKEFFAKCRAEQGLLPRSDELGAKSSTAEELGISEKHGAFRVEARTHAREDNAHARASSDESELSCNLKLASPFKEKLASCNLQVRKPAVPREPDKIRLQVEELLISSGEWGKPEFREFWCGLAERDPRYVERLLKMLRTSQVKRAAQGKEPIFRPGARMYKIAVEEGKARGL